MTASSISWIDIRSSTMRTDGMTDTWEGEASAQGTGKSTIRAAESPPAAPGGSTHAARHRAQLEDRQEHRHDDAADDDAENDDEQGLDQRCERGHGGVALDIVEVRD